MCILELSKVLMYELHYDYIKNEHDDKSKLLFTDIHSVMYEIRTEDAFKDFSSNKEIFDFSNFLAKSKYYNNLNKLVIGKIKDEIGGVAIEKFIALKPKMHSFFSRQQQ